jgi:hypothetical protein
MGSPGQNPDCSSTVESALETSGLTSCSIRLWAIDRKDLRWSSGHAAVCLMADLLTAGGGQLVQETPGGLMAQFDRSERALTAARRLQRALYTFTEGRETNAFGASIVIYRPEDQVRPHLGLAVPDLLWSDFAAPGQILISGSAHEILQVIPGLQFHAVSLDSNSSPAYHELLWIDPEVLAAWRERVMTAARLVPVLHQNQELEASPAEVGAGPTISPATALANPDGSQFGSSIPDGPGKERRWVAGGAILALLVITLGVVLYMRSGKTNATAAQQELKGKATVQQPPASVNGPATPGGAPQGEGAGAAEGAKPESGEVPVQAKPHKPTREAQTAVAEYDGFTPKQIPQLVRKAEEDAGAGNYEAARREYEIVLKLQPGNISAKEGLQKLSLKINERR